MQGFNTYSVIVNKYSVGKGLFADLLDSFDEELSICRSLKNCFILTPERFLILNLTFIKNHSDNSYSYFDRQLKTSFNIEYNSLNNIFLNSADIKDYLKLQTLTGISFLKYLESKNLIKEFT